jgi:hypothetical protein
MRKDNYNPNEESSQSQAKKILAYLKAGNRITPIEALEKFGSFRLGARIADLRADGHEIQSEFVTTPNGKRVKSYWINC